MKNTSGAISIDESSMVLFSYDCTKHFISVLYPGGSVSNKLVSFSSRYQLTLLHHLLVQLISGFKPLGSVGTREVSLVCEPAECQNPIEVKEETSRQLGSEMDQPSSKQDMSTMLARSQLRGYLNTRNNYGPRKG